MPGMPGPVRLRHAALEALSLPGVKADLCQLPDPLLQTRYAGARTPHDEVFRPADDFPTSVAGVCTPAGWAKEGTGDGVSSTNP